MHYTWTQLKFTYHFLVTFTRRTLRSFFKLKYFSTPNIRCWLQFYKRKSAQHKKKPIHLNHLFKGTHNKIANSGTVRHILSLQHSSLKEITNFFFNNSDMENVIKLDSSFCFISQHVSRVNFAERVSWKFFEWISGSLVFFKGISRDFCVRNKLHSITRLGVNDIC